MASVDVVIPNYQYGRYLRGCVHSVLSQDVGKVRVLIVDNASTDDSQEVAMDLRAKDPRVHLLAHKRNFGPHFSFNEGIDWAQSDYFLILCSDDLLAPGALKRAVAVMEEYPDVHLTFGRSEAIGGDAPVPAMTIVDEPPNWRISTGRELIEQFCRTGRNHVPGPSAIVRTAIQKRVGHYRPELTHTDDLEVWLRFGLHGAAAQTSAVQAIARTHPVNQSSSVRNILSWDHEYEAAFESFFSREGAALPDAKRLLQTARHSLSDRAYWSGLAHLCRREAQAGFELLRFAIRRKPLSVVVPPVPALLRRSDAGNRIRSNLLRTLWLHAHVNAPGQV